MNRFFLNTSRALMMAATVCFAASSCNDDEAETEAMAENLDTVVLNEINGSQDYIELYNSGDAQVSLKGAKIRRWRINAGVKDKQTLWEGTTEVIAPKSYLCLKFEEGKEGSAYYLKRDFSARKNTYIWLQDVSQAEISNFKRGQEDIGWNQVHMQKCANDTGLVYSYSRVGKEWVYAIPTPGTANGEKQGDIDQNMFPVVINEIDFAQNKIELYNVSSTRTVNICGAELRWSRLDGKGEEDNCTLWYATGTTNIEPNGFYVVNVDNTVNKQDGDIDLSDCVSVNFRLRLRDSSGDGHVDFTNSRYVFDEIKRGVKGSGWAQDTLSKSISGNLVRVPDGTGDWESTETPSMGSTNGTLHSGKNAIDLEIDGY